MSEDNTAGSCPFHPNANKAPNPNGPVDHEVPALRVEAPDRRGRRVEQAPQGRGGQGGAAHVGARR